jgi:hypothetical protein
MTALHWAAYHDHERSVELLLRNGAVQTLSFGDDVKNQLAPIDVAADRDINARCIEIFIDHLQKKFDMLPTTQEVVAVSSALLENQVEMSASWQNISLARNLVHEGSVTESLVEKEEIDIRTVYWAAY